MTTRAELQTLTVERLRREIPDDLDWIPWHDLPALRWATDGTSVDERFPRGWLVLAVERKNPVPDDDLWQQAALFHPGDATNLASWLLERWIEHDTAVPELSTARRAELRDIAEQAAGVAKRFGRGGSDPEERFRQLLQQEENRPAPSALPYRGLLAVVGACGDHRTASSVRSFLTTWHIERPETSRALLRMLSSMRSTEASAVLEEAMHLPALSSFARELRTLRSSLDPR